MVNLKSVFKYLDLEAIDVDKEEFDFQFNSHPNFPSLLALSDTLNFFNVNNGAFKIDSSEIDLLPNNFLVRLKKEHTGFLSFVQKRDNSIIYTNGTNEKHSATKIEFEALWDNVVLIAENDSKEVPILKKSKPKLTLSLLLVSALFFVAISLVSVSNKWLMLFYVLPILGLFLSVSALKDLFKTKSKLLDKFCNVTAATSCDTVVNSSKWSKTEFKTK